ncbi:MAG: hypothetical protein RI973_2018 [Bacteroidota bacterium]|jgi:hypothetical protein
MKLKLLLLCAISLLSLKNGFSQKKNNAADFFNTEKIQDINITFPQANWAYILDSLRFNGNGMLEGTVEINGEKFNGAGIRYRGSKSFAPGQARNPLHIELNFKEQAQSLDGYTTLKLSNTLRDPSMLREVLGYEIARMYMPAPRANFARVSVNKQYYGLMANIESVEEAKFLERYFGTAANAFFKVNQSADEKAPAGCKNNIYGSLEYDQSPACYDHNFEKISDHGTNALIELARILNEKPENAGTVLNVDATLWMLAFNNLIVNLSSYSGQHSVNYYLYQDANGRFTPIIWDLNLAFGSFKNIGSGSDLKLKQLQELDPLLYADNPSKPLVSKLMENPTWRKQYLSHLRTILNDHFLNGAFEARAKALQKLIWSDFSRDKNQSYTQEDFSNSVYKTVGKKSKIPGLTELMTARASFLKTHPELSIFPPDITGVSVQGRQPLSSKRIEHFHITARVDKYPKKVSLFYKLGSAATFAEVLMADDGKNDDGVAGNGIYGITIVPQNGETAISYYIVAENAGLLSYSPAKYMWEQHKATLEELNK